MAEVLAYRLPPVWTEPAPDAGRWSAINSSQSGARFEAALPVGRHDLQLYSQGTPNGQKVTIALEELLAMGKTGAEYDAWLVEIGKGDQFSSGFVALNPNSKIPALVDRSGPEPVRVFESGAILLYLADRFGGLLPAEGRERVEALNWLFWLQGAAPFIGGGFGHFFAYAPFLQEYPINRYTMETKRLFDVLDRRLATSTHVGGEQYGVADIAAWPWVAAIANNEIYDAAKFLDVESYVHVRRWVDEVGRRPAVRRGRLVNKPIGEGLPERHDATDLDALFAGENNV